MSIFPSLGLALSLILALRVRWSSFSCSEALISMMPVFFIKSGRSNGGFSIPLFPCKYCNNMASSPLEILMKKLKAQSHIVNGVYSKIILIRWWFNYMGSRAIWLVKNWIIQNSIIFEIKNKRIAAWHISTLRFRNMLKYCSIEACLWPIYLRSGW